MREIIELGPEEPDVSRILAITTKDITKIRNGPSGDRQRLSRLGNIHEPTPDCVACSCIRWNLNVLNNRPYRSCRMCMVCRLLPDLDLTRRCFNEKAILM